MRERALDELLEVLDGRFRSKHRLHSYKDSLRSTAITAIARRVPMSSRGFRPDYTIMRAVVCPLCGERTARRGCPALGQQICAVCCGTKRLIEIALPGDCVYLASAREHPPAVAVRQQQRDVATARAVHARLQRAAVAAVLSDQHVPASATSRRSCSRSSTTTWPRRRRRWRPRSKPRRAASSTSIGRRRCRPSGWSRR